MKLKYLGIFGIISLLSYTAMVVFSPLAYPGYDRLSMAVSDLSAEGAPSQALAERLNALFGPCGIVSVMAVCVAVRQCQPKTFRLGICFFAAMEWITVVGYKIFPLSQGEDMAAFQKLGAIGTGVMPKAVFGLFERFSTFSAVIFNAVLGVYLLKGKFEKQGFTDKE